MPLAKIYLTRDIFTVIVYILYLYTPNILWGELWNLNALHSNLLTESAIVNL